MPPCPFTVSVPVIILNLVTAASCPRPSSCLLCFIGCMFPYTKHSLYWLCRSHASFLIAERGIRRRQGKCRCIHFEAVPRVDGGHNWVVMTSRLLFLLQNHHHISDILCVPLWCMFCSCSFTQSVVTRRQLQTGV